MHERKLSFYVMAWMSVVLDLSARGVAPGQTEEVKLQVPSRQESIEILSMLSLQIRGNSEKVRAWEGDVEFVLDRYTRGEQAASLLEQRKIRKPKGIGQPQTVKRRVTGTIRFVLDKARKSHYEKFTRTQPVRYSDGNGIELGTESGPHQAVSIITPERYMGSVTLAHV